MSSRLTQLAVNLLLVAPVLACAPAPPPRQVILVPAATASPAPPPAVAPAALPAAPAIRVASSKRTLDDPLADLDSDVPFLSCDDPTLQRALNVINDQIAEAAERALKDMAQLVRTSQHGGLSSMRYLSMDCSAITTRPEVVSILCVVSTYTGGVHPNTDYVTHNFTIHDGEVTPIDLAMLTSGETATQSLGRRATLGLLAQGTAMWTDDPLTADAMRAFALEPKGLHFFFAPYVVSGYAQGAQDLLLPWHHVEDLIRHTPELDPVLALAHAARPCTKPGGCPTLGPVTK